MQYILLLRNDKDLTHLNETYEEYHIADVKRSSKTQYEYTASFTCKDKDCKGLEEILASDNKVLEYEIVPLNIGEVETSKGSKAHRTGPIGSQGGQ